MKITNSEISKKLKEIGFDVETDFYWVKWNEGLPALVHKSEITPALIEKVPAYDLETLIDALPKKIQFKQEEYCFWMQWSGCSDCLLLGYVYGNSRAIELEVWQLENESLADTAGRLIITLWEKEIIKFKE